MVKKLETDPSKEINNIIADKFKIIRKRYSLNLDSIFKKSFDRAINDGLMGGNTDEAKKSVIRNKLGALKNVMLGDIDQIENRKSQDIARTIATAYAQGKSSGKIKTELIDQLGQTDFEVERAIRTNAAYLSSLTKLRTWQEMGFTHYTWRLGKNDERTREQHKKWHGKEFSIADALSGRAPMPGHVVDKNTGKVNLSQSINCRCGIRLSR